MNKTTATTMTGLAVALTAGTAVYMMNHNHHKASSTGKKLKRNAGKALKTLGNVLDSVEVMMR